MYIFILCAVYNVYFFKTTFSDALRMSFLRLNSLMQIAKNWLTTEIMHRRFLSRARTLFLLSIYFKQEEKNLPLRIFYFNVI